MDMGDLGSLKRKPEADLEDQHVGKLSKHDVDVDGVEETQSLGHLVFCCIHCRTIVGDSLALLSSHAELKTITLSKATKVNRQDSLCTVTTDSVDKCGTYFPIQCAQCCRSIGRYYISTPRALDEIRERFTFLVDEISSYELGSAELGEDIVQDRKQHREASAAGAEEDKNKEKMFEEQFEKLYHIVLGLEYRVLELEKIVGVTKR
jgi:hypothetical protein